MQKGHPLYDLRARSTAGAKARLGSEKAIRRLPKNWKGPGRAALQQVLGDEFAPRSAQGLTPSQLRKFLSRRGPWREKEAEPFGFFCPLCHVERKLPTHPNPWNARHLLQIALLTAVFTLASNPWLGWKGWVAFVPFWMAFEIFFRLRMRGQLRCEQCGFDPILYLTDVQRARKEVEAHWRDWFERKGLPVPGTRDS
jgi:hypothetical protein